MTDTPVLLSVSDGAATITLNRPDSGNAIDMAFAEALLAAALICDSDEGVRSVTLTGVGRFFCVGGDIGAFQNAGDDVQAFLSELAGKLHMAISRLMRMNKPLLTVVNGPAAGAGLSLAICGDIVLAARSATFTSAYSRIGLTPDGGISWLLPRLVGMRRAQEILIENRTVAAEEAALIGLATRVVDDDLLAREAASVGANLANSAVSALGGARALLLESYGGSFEGQLEREARSIAQAGGRAENREGIAAFRERRAPDFRGTAR